MFRRILFFAAFLSIAAAAQSVAQLKRQAEALKARGDAAGALAITEKEYGYRQRKVLYRNLGNGRFLDVSESAGPGILEKVTGRGCAMGDFDNDGDLDVVVNCVNDVPQLLRCDNATRNTWIKIKCVGTNPTAPPSARACTV